jgi:hypothetical protein
MSDSEIEDQSKILDNANVQIKNLNKQLLKLSIEISNVDVTSNDKLKELLQLEYNIVSKINSNRKIINIINNSTSDTIGNNQENSEKRIIIQGNSANKSVKIPPNLDKFDPKIECSDVYLDYIESKSLAVGNTEDPQHHVSVLLFYLPERSKYEKFVRENMVGKKLSWSILKNMFIEKFNPKDNETKARDSLLDFDWSSKNENVKDAAYRFSKLSMRAKEDINNRVHIQRFIRKAPIKLQEEFARKFNINQFTNFEQLED